LEFPEGWGVLEKIPSMGEVWVLSGTTHYSQRKHQFKKHCFYFSQGGKKVVGVKAP